MQPLLGFILAIIIAYLAYRAHSLNQSGVIAAVVVGTVIFGLGGLQWAILLLIFFITSSALSRLFKKRKQGLDEKFSKGHELDAGQVFGNGGVATAFVLVHAFRPESTVGWVGFAAALAAVNADTWATEEGQHVDVSIYECLVRGNYREPVRWEHEKKLGVRSGNLFSRGRISRRQLWPCKDGYVTWMLLPENPKAMLAFIEWMETEEQAGRWKGVKDERSLVKLTQEELSSLEQTTGAFISTHPP